MIRRVLLSFTLPLLISSIAQSQPSVSRPSPPIADLAAVSMPDLPPLHFDPPSSQPTYILPAQGQLSSGYGWRWGRMHQGIDIAGPIGSPILAAAAGTVEFAGWTSGGYGNLIEIRHADGSLTRYAHLDRVGVQLGDRVTQGQVIGTMGSTGRSTGPHLHFEVHRVGQGAIDPIGVLAQGGR